MKKINLLFISIIATFLQINAQGLNYIQNIVPQTPESNAILKSFETPVSLYTGSPDISVPVYSIKEGDINFDIKLSYNSTGITVGERASWVGLGWNLSVPTLVRNVRQVPDDFSYGFFYETKYTVNNVYNIKKVLTPNTPVNNSCTQCYEIDNLYRSNLLDLESDDYRITLPDGKSISFMVNQERDAEHPIGHIVQFPDSDYKIEYITSNGNWEIINPQGYKYLYIKGNVINYSYTYSIGGNSLGTLPEKKDQPYTSTWVLSKITSPSNHILNFGYDPVIYEDCDLINQTKTVDLFSEHPDPNDSRNTVYTNYSKTRGTNLFISRIWGDFGEAIFNKDSRLDFTTYGRKLNNVEIKNKTNVISKVSFDYDYMISPSPAYPSYTCNRFENDNDISKRLILKKINIYANTDKPSSYQFNYDDTSLPNRLSYARDLWGYYNGEIGNTGLTPSIDVVVTEPNKRNVDPSSAKAGILKEIIYPTGGKTKFLFESNRGIYYGDATGTEQQMHNNIPTKNKYVYFSTHEDDTQQLNKTYVMPFPVNSNDFAVSTQMIPMRFTTTTTNCIYPENSLPYINSCSIYYSVLDNDNNVVLGRSLLQNGFSMTHSFAKNQLINGLKVKMEVYSGRIRPQSQYFNYLQDEAAIEVAYTILDSTLVTNTGVGLEVPFGGLRIKRIENTENMQAPIIKEYDYKFNGIETGLSSIQLDFLQRVPEKSFVTSQSRFPMQTGNGSLIAYTNAKEYRINPITNERNNISHIFLNNYSVGSYIGACIFNQGLGGALISASVPCFEDPRNGKPLFTDYSGKKAESLEYEDIYLTGKNLSWVYGMDYDRVIRNSDFIYLGAGVTTPTFLGADFFYYKFKNFDDPDYSKETKDYLNGKELITKTEYKSLHPSHHQMTKEKVELPDGTVTETNYGYAHEKSNQLMIDRNMIGIPLETTTTQTKEGVTKTLGKTETLYPTSVPTPQAGNLVLPLSVKSADQLTGVMSTEVSYDKYDEKGNILQYTTRDGIPVTIVWGYNKTQPIAKIEGITYDQLTSLASPTAIVTASDNDAADPSKEGLLLEALNSFRKNSQLTDKKVTTYTYDPLIGVTSITPPSGIRQVFAYDTANRLKETKVRSKNSAGAYTDKKAAEYKYNYKP
ncbi:hypothetical protein [Chryseobacterium gregarium]|uniref:hypothetical protein n=1 Tax=Chryseobacterium gregarium TaxID=456299 RepID=UPI0003F733D0|nr:hypothetical protein [Chryseobacterium gregarium]